MSKRFGKVKVSFPFWMQPNTKKIFADVLKMKIEKEQEHGFFMIYGTCKHFDKIENRSLVPEYSPNFIRKFKKRPIWFCRLFMVPVLKEWVELQSVEKVEAA